MPRIYFVRTKLTTYNSTGSTACQSAEEGSFTESYKYPKKKIVLGSNDYLLPLIKEIIVVEML
jgi:hypothetical protein